VILGPIGNHNTDPFRAQDSRIQVHQTDFNDPDVQRRIAQAVACGYCGRVWQHGARGWDGVTCWDGWQGCGAGLESNQ